VHIRYNETNDLWEYLVSVGPEVWSTLPIKGEQISGGVISVDGVKFPATQVASSNVNTQDDYEEGDCTPVIGGAGGTTGQTYSIQYGKYIKKGKSVEVQIYAVLTAKGTITGAVQIQGLPFVSENVTNGFAICSVWWAALATTWVYLTGLLAANASVIGLVGTAAAGASSNTALATADIANNTQFMISIKYRSAN